MFDRGLALIAVLTVLVIAVIAFVSVYRVASLVREARAGGDEEVYAPPCALGRFSADPIPCNGRL